MVLERSEDTHPYHPETIITCFYRETQKNGATRREFVYPLKKQQKSAKRIVIPLVSEKTRDMHERRMQEAEEIKKDPSRRANIKKSLETLVRIVDICECNEYRSEMERCSSSLKDIRSANCNLYQNSMSHSWIGGLRDVLRNSNVFDSKFMHLGHALWNSDYMDDLLLEYRKILDELLERNNMSSTGIDASNWKSNLEKAIEEENKVLLNQIKDFEKDCAESTESLSEDSVSLVKQAKDLTMMYINMLTKEGIPLCKQQDEVLSKYMSEDSNKIEDKADPWNRSLVSLLVGSWGRYSNIEEGPQKRIGEIVAVIREENTRIKQGIKTKKECAPVFINMPEIVDALKRMIRLLEEEIYYQNDTEQNEYYEAEEEIPKEGLDDLNIRICDDIIFILADIDIAIAMPEEEPGTAENRLRAMEEKIYSLVGKIVEFYTGFTSIEALAKSAEENKKEIVDSFLSIAFGNCLLAESACEEVAVLKEVARGMLSRFADVLHHRYAVLINYNKYGSISAQAEEEKASISKCDMEEALQCLLNFAYNFWYSPEHYSELTQCMKKAIVHKNSLEYITEEHPSLIKEILVLSYQAYKYIDDLVLCDEIWKNTAVLYVGKFFKYIQHKSKEVIPGYVVFQKEQEHTHIKEIEFSDENLEAFRNAKDTADIEKLKGAREE